MKRLMPWQMTLHCRMDEDGVAAAIEKWVL